MFGKRFENQTQLGACVPLRVHAAAGFIPNAGVYHQTSVSFRRQPHGALGFVACKIPASQPTLGLGISASLERP